MNVDSSRVCKVVLLVIGLFIYLMLGCNAEVAQKTQIKTESKELLAVYIIKNGECTGVDKVDFKDNTLTAMGPNFSDRPKKIGIIHVNLSKREVSDIFTEASKGRFDKFKIKLAWLKETPHHIGGDAWMAFDYGIKKCCFKLPTQKMMNNISKDKIVSYKKMFRIYDEVTSLIYDYRNSEKVESVSQDDKRWKKAMKEGDILIDLSYSIK